MGKQETLSVTYIQELCANSGHLSGDGIKLGDKAPSFDGHIVYYSEKDSIKLYGKEMFIPVQIKGEFVEKISNMATYSIDMIHMNNYNNNGGVLFLYVSIFNKKRELFALSLLPEDISDIILGKESQKSVTVHLNRIDDELELVEICKKFVNNRKKYLTIKNNTEILFGLTPQYDKIYKCEENYLGNEFIYSEGNIFLHAYLPAKRNFRISLGITLRKYDKEGLIFTFDNSEIILKLFLGVKTPIELCARGYIDFQTNGVYGINFNGTHLDIEEELVLELSNGIDRLFDDYVKNITLVENECGVRSFHYSPLQGFKMLEIKYELWQYMCEYIHNHNGFQDNPKEKDIFEPNEYMIKIYTNGHSKYGNGYHAILHLIKADDGYLFTNNYWICWSFMRMDLDNSTFNEKKIWSLEYTYNWMFEIFIPDVISYILKKTKRKDKKFVERNLKNSYRNREIDYINNYKDINTLEFIEIFRKLQIFYSIQRQIFLDELEIKNMYICLRGIVCVCRTLNKEDIKYISCNISERVEKFKDLIDILDDKIKGTKDGIVSTYTIRLIFDSILCCIEQYNNLLVKEDIMYHLGLIEESIERFNNQTLIDKTKEY